METRANYLMVGSFVLVLFVGVILFVLWLAKFQADQEFRRYDIFFSGSVSGLTKGSTVNYRGIGVGEVIDIRIDPEDVQRIQVTIEVSADTPIKTDTVASLQLQGITGGSVVALSGGSNEAGDLVPPPGRERPVIASEASGLEKLLEGAPELVESVDLLVRNANLLLSAANREAVGKVLQDVAVVSGVFAGRADDIDRALGDAAKTLESLRAASAALSVLATRLDRNLTSLMNQGTAALKSVESTAANTDELLQELGGTARSATEAADQMAGMIKENRIPIRDFMATGLYDAQTFISELRSLVNAMNRFAVELGRDPAQFIFGGQQRGYEAN